MTRHLSSEALSAYLDGETTPAEALTFAGHLAACAACRSRLESTRRLVRDLSRLAAVAPPPELALRVRQHIAAAGRSPLPPAARSAAGRPDLAPATRATPAAPAANPPALRAVPGRAASSRAAGAPSFLVSLKAWLAGPLAALRTLRRSLLVSDHPLWHASWRAAAGAPLGIALAFGVAVLFVRGDAVPGPLGSEVVSASPAGASAPLRAVRPEFRVSETFGDAPALPPQTTSEVAGRVFVLGDGVWVERGLDADSAHPALVRARSPQGRLLLARFSDLGVLLADGARVVLLDNRQTLELSNDS